MRSPSILFPVIEFAAILSLVSFLGACSHQSVSSNSFKETRPLVLTTDFGEKDGAVSAMRGVAYQVSDQLLISDLTHEIPPYDIWQASYRLKQTSPYWKSSVFVTVVDPGVGSDRKSVVARTRSGHLFVGPDNGHLTLVNEIDPVVETRVIDESKNRLKGSEESYTFHGRDLYVYVGARLASGQLAFADVGPVLEREIIKIPHQAPSFEAGVLKGGIPILDPNYGNVWTNLSKTLVRQHFPNAKKLKVRIFNQGRQVYQAQVPLVETFAAVSKGQPLLYFNSLLDLSIALNQGNFALKYKIKGGPDWTISVQE